MPGLVRHALRSLRHRPGTAVTVIATLTLAIGANSAIFSAVDAILLQPLPYPAADRPVSIHETNLQQHETEGLVAPIRVTQWGGPHERSTRLPAAISRT